MRPQFNSMVTVAFCKIAAISKLALPDISNGLHDLPAVAAAMTTDSDGESPQQKTQAAKVSSTAIEIPSHKTVLRYSSSCRPPCRGEFRR